MTSTLHQLDRLKVLIAEGTPTEIGRAHGARLRDEIAAGAVPRFAVALDRFGIGSMADALDAAIETALPEDYRQELAGLAEGSGQPLRLLRRASFLSESLQILAPLAGVEDQPPPAGCTAAVARAGATAHGELIYGKNQDYAGAGWWDRDPLLLITRLEGAIPYAKVTSPGFLKGNVSLNAAGLSIGGHFIFSSGARPQGALFTVLENEVMRRCRTLDEALAVFDRPIFGAFGFVIVDGDANRAAIVEADSEGVRVREMTGDTLAFSNIFAEDDPAQGGRDLLRRWGAHRNPLSREARMTELLAGAAPAIEVSDVIRFLGDQLDPPSGARRAAACSIAQVVTVTSAVVQPRARRLWCAVGEAPVSNTAYLAIDLAATFADGTAPSIADTIQGLGGDAPGKLEGARCCARAQATFEDGDPAAALTHLEAAIKQDPDEPLYYRLAARLDLRAGERAKAAERLAVAAGLPQSTAEALETAWLTHLASKDPDMAGLQNAWNHAAKPPTRPLDLVNPRLLARVQRTLAGEATDLQRLPLDFTMTGPLS